MIGKGGVRGDGRQLANYLLNNKENEIADIVEQPYEGKTLDFALRAMERQAHGTRCKNPLYHFQMSPAPGEGFTAEQVKDAVDTYERHLGFKGLPRVVVMHQKIEKLSDYKQDEQAQIREKLGLAADATTFRHRHYHVVWQRIDPETRKARSYSNNWIKHEAASREIETRFGIRRVVGRHVDLDGNVLEEKPPRQWKTKDEAEQEKRTGDLKKHRAAEITDIWNRTDTGRAFRTALEEAGYTLAKGDRRDFVVVNRLGEAYSVARQINGVCAADVRARLKDIDDSNIPAVRDIQRQMRQAAKDRARERFGDHLAALIRSEDPGREEPPQKPEQERPEASQGDRPAGERPWAPYDEPARPEHAQRSPRDRQQAAGTTRSQPGQRAQTRDDEQIPKDAACQCRLKSPQKCRLKIPHFVADTVVSLGACHGA